MIGQRLSNRYEVVGELGRGGMGVVYRAKDPLLNREVAVKLIPPGQLGADAVQRFQREAQLVAQMDHPSIVSIYDFGDHEGSLFFVMPLVQGTNLRAFLRPDSVLGDVLDVGVQVAEALEYSHAQGVVHRDIKPENIMVSRDDATGVRVRVMDFGLARAGSESRLTKTGTMVGTLSYLSPEQVSGKPVDGRSDVYALGTVLYECLVGQPPFGGGGAEAVLYRIVHEFPQPARLAGAAIDEELDALVMRCLAKDPQQRPLRAAELAEDLKRYRARLNPSERDRSVTGFTRTFHVARPALAPLVGRGKEFAELQQRLNAALQGECQFAVVAGEPGIGKTRLLDELASLARARQIRVLHGRSVEQDRAFAYQGFCEIIQQFFRAKETGSAPPPDFSDLAADLLALFPMLAEISEIRSAASGESKLARGGSTGPENRAQVFELIARTLTRIAGGRPIVLILEDLHGAEVTIDALPYIVTRLGPTPTLILGSYRTTEVDKRHPLTRALDGFRGDRRFAAITLGPFSPSDHRAFVETLVEGGQVPAGLAERLFEGTEGNPFFTKELVRSLLDSGGIARDESGRYSLAGDSAFSAEAMPATIQEVVEKRVERLPPELREVLEIASVIGKSFDSRDLEALAKDKEVDEAIDRLVQQGLLEELREGRGELLSFASGVVRDVLYAGLSPRRRRSLHRRCAEILEARHAGRVERVLAQLVRHYYQGDVPEKAVEHGLKLARASLDAFSAEEAARSARAALDFLDEEWEGDRALEGEARMLLARAHQMAGEVEEALREGGAAAQVFEKLGQTARAASALRFAAETAWHAQRAEEAARLLARGVDAARAAGERGELHELLSLGATIANLRGDHETANAYLDEESRLGAALAPAEASPALPRGGRLIVALANSVRSVEPPATLTTEESEIAGNVFETLLATDADGKLAPALCERWEPDAEGRTFLLTLRPDVRFSDGRPLQAADVKASIELAIKSLPTDVPAAFSAIRGARELAAGQAGEAAGVVVRGELKLEVQLTEPLPLYPALLTATGTAIRHRAGEGSSVGTGPFAIASVAADRVVLARNDGYWRGSPPLVDAVEFRTGMRASEIAAGFRAGELDVARDLLPQDLDELLRDARFRSGLAEIAKKDTYFVLFNSTSGPVARHEPLRRALAGVLRTRDLVWRALGRFAQPAVCLLPPGMLGHDSGRRRTALERDAALELLRQAGVAPPVRLTAAVHPVMQDRYGALTAALFRAWSELGVEVQVATSGMEAFLAADSGTAAFDMKVGRWIHDYDDPDDFTHALFHSATGRFRAWFASPESDQLLEEARGERRPATRETLYRRFESLLQERAALVPLFHDIDYRLAGQRVRGLVLRGQAPFVNYASLAKLAEAAPEPEARLAGGTINVPISGPVLSLDPALAATFEQSEVLPAVFESLTRVDPGGARIVPWLAAEFHAEDGGRCYRFRLRDDVRFHDGRRLSSRDVRYSYERLLQCPDAPYRSVLESIEGARALLDGQAADLAGFRIHSAREFSIELVEGVSFFPALVAYPAVAIVPEGSDPSGLRGLEGCVGTGPFRPVAFEPGRRVELERNRGYWRRGLPRCERIVFSLNVSSEEMAAGFRAGRFTIASDLFPAEVEALRREPAFAASYCETPRLITYYAAFNRNRGPLADPALRQRLVRAVDVAPLVRQTIGRLAVPAHGMIPPGLLGFEPEPAARPAPPPAPAGPAGPIELAAAVHPLFFGRYSAFAREVEAAFARLEVKLRPVNRTMPEWIEATRAGATDVVVGRWGADYPDTDSMVGILSSAGGMLGRLCGSPALDRLIERGRRESAPAARHAIYRELEQSIAREAVLLPLFHEVNYRFGQPALQNLSVSFSQPAVPYAELFLKG